MKTLKELMDDHNLTLLDLQLKSRVNIADLCRIKNNTLQPSTAQKKKIATSFGVNVGDIRFPECKLQEAHGA